MIISQHMNMNVKQPHGILHPHQICQTHYRLEILAHELCIIEKAIL